MLRRPKRANNKVVAPKEEEEEARMYTVSHTRICGRFKGFQLHVISDTALDVPQN
jgi:hypothetical protein